MHIGIIIYSLGGNTISVATQLKERLSTAGHDVMLKRIETVGPASLRTEDAPLKSKPALDAYDAFTTRHSWPRA
jgi:flavodoxin